MSTEVVPEIHVCHDTKNQRHFVNHTRFTENILKLPACFVVTPKVNTNLFLFSFSVSPDQVLPAPLEVLLGSSTVLPDLLWWSSAPPWRTSALSDQLWWSSAPTWRATVSSDLLRWLSALPWRSSAQPSLSYFGHCSSDQAHNCSMDQAHHYFTA